MTDFQTDQKNLLLYLNKFRRKHGIHNLVYILAELLWEEDLAGDVTNFFQYRLDKEREEEEKLQLG